MPATVVGSGDNRKNETQVLNLLECPFQLTGRRENKMSEDRQMGMRSLFWRVTGKTQFLNLYSSALSSQKVTGQE